MERLGLFLKEIPVNKFINRILLNTITSVCAICFVTPPVMANMEDSACQETGVVFSFFNGVQNTSLQALRIVM